MTIKTYRGTSIADALAQVKRELGRDAVILHTRSYKTGGLLGIGARSITEITATADPAAIRRYADASRARSNHRKPSRQPVGSPARDAEPAPVQAPPADSIEFSFAGSGIPSSPSSREAPPGTPPAAHAPPSIATLPSRAPEGGATDTLRRDIESLKQMVGRVLQSSKPGPGPAMPEELFRCYLTLLEAEVANEIADEIVANVRDELSTSELTDPELVRRAVVKRLASYIAVTDMDIETAAPDDDRPLTITLVGPTGVGKTTTLAKLAATYKLRHGKRVGLITCDTYRIAAVEQLRTYANIIGIPVEVVLTEREMAHAIDSFSECDVILIDTAGRSQRDDKRLEELRGYLAVAKPHQTHLVLSSAASEAVLRDAVERFAVARPDHVIFTKLDEAVNFGVLINTARRINASLSFVTMGQEVPDHIEPGDAMRLAGLVLGEEGAL